MIRFLQTPGPVKKYVLGGLLLLICVSMVWYLVPSGGNTGLGGRAGRSGQSWRRRSDPASGAAPNDSDAEAAVSTRRRTNGDADAILCPACGRKPDQPKGHPSRSRAAWPASKRSGIERRVAAWPLCTGILSGW